MKKYEFTGETKRYGTAVLHRIRAVRAFGDVKAGDVGGWIEKEYNLSHEGNCWVYEEAKVLDYAVVKGNAKAKGRSLICDCAILYDDAVSCDLAVMKDNAKVGGKAVIYGSAVVYDEAEIYSGMEICFDNHIGRDVKIIGIAKGEEQDGED